MSRSHLPSPYSHLPSLFSHLPSPIPLLLSLLSLLLSLISPLAHAQSVGRVEQMKTNMTTYYYLVQPGEATVQAAIWGTVRNAGVYEVSAGTTLGRLFALSGGPALTSIRNERDRRRIAIRLYRDVEGNRTTVFDGDMETLSLDASGGPTLKDGDIVNVEAIEKRPFSWRDTMPFVSAAASVLVAISYFSR